MECNKDEAVRVKEIAEKKLLEKDIMGAKKFALKAQNLFPGLDGLSQFLETIDVYVAHEKKINGEADYYGIFGVDSFAGEEVMKRQYKRMALSLHPDKNKSVGADGAFTILSEAWSMLSNKEKRSAYDFKLNIRASNHISGLSSSTTRYATPACSPQNVSTLSSTPGTATSQPCSFASCHPRKTMSGTNYQQSRCHQWTPAAATVVDSHNVPPCQPGSSMLGNSPKHTAAAGSQYGSSPRSPLNLTPGTSSMNIPDDQSAPMTAVQCETLPVPAHAWNPRMIPGHRKVPLQAFAAQDIPSPRPHFYNQHFPFRNQPTSSTYPSRPETFWTLCNRCRIQYEYPKVYLNQNILCPHCQLPFLATKMPAPNVNGRSSCPSVIPHQQQSMTATSIGSRSMPPLVSRTFQPASCQPSCEHTKRKHEMAVNMGVDSHHWMKNGCTFSENVETASASCTVSGGLDREKPVKKRCKDVLKCDAAKEGSQGTAGSMSGVKKASENVREYFGEKQQSRSAKGLSQFEKRAMIMGKAKMEILCQLNKWETEKSDSSHLKRAEKRNSLNALTIDSVKHPRTYKSRGGLFSESNSTSQLRNTSSLKETDLDAQDEFVSMIVPDANFHNFDEDRVEESFNQGQIWAAYDDDDGMPRYYALVHHVKSRSPFKMQISWLNSKSSSEFGPLDWITSGFTKTTGDFNIGKFEASNRLNSFSHPVKCRKETRGVIQIFPTKGDVWALYRNWSPDWDDNTADEVIHKYDLVVVLQDYVEHAGVLVASLVKVAGFTSVFNQLLHQREIKKIPREEMFRFSHQVPFHKLNGLEAENAPKDCYELDPAALPLELLKATADAEPDEGRVSGHPTLLKGSMHGSEAMKESTSLGKINSHQERSSDEDIKYLLKYSRRNTRRKIKGNFSQSQQ